jgi:hypothetical protein
MEANTFFTASGVDKGHNNKKNRVATGSRIVEQRTIKETF